MTVDLLLARDRYWREKDEKIEQKSAGALRAGDEIRSTVLWEAFLQEEIRRLEEKERSMRKQG